MIRGGVASANGNKEDAEKLFRDGAKQCEQAAMNLYAAGARRQRGILLGGSDGKTLVDEADSWMQEQGIANPERMAQLFVPCDP